MSDAAKRALMAAAARHRLRTEGRTSDPAKKKPGAGWTPEERAYLIECIASTIARRVERGTLTDRDAWFLGRSTARLAVFDGRAKYVHAPRLLDLIVMPCASCHRTARHRVGLRGYCDVHAGAGVSDRRRMTAQTEIAKTERSEFFEAREKDAIRRLNASKYRGIHRKERA